MAISCDHPRPKLELPGKTPERQRWSPPTYIPNLDPNASRVIQEALRGIYSELARALARSAVVPLIEDLQALDGQTIVGVGDGQTVTLPQPLDDGTVGSVRFVLDEIVSPVTVVNPDGSTYLLDQPGIYDVAIVPGTQAWTANAGVTSGGTPSGAEYLLGATHTSLPNSRVAQDSTELDVDLTAPGLVSWALRTASVVFSKLADLTGLSVLGRSASSTGVMAAITATGARQVLQANDAGTALQWGLPVQVSDDGSDIGDFYDINFVAGTNSTTTVTDAGSGRANVTIDVPDSELTWAQVLARGATSGASNPIVDAGQFLQLGAVGPTTNSPQIRSGDAVLRITGGVAVTTTATTAAALIGGTTATLLAGTGASVTTVTGNVTLTAPTSGVVNVSNGFLRLTESAASTPSMGAGQGLVWARSDTPNVPMFTDDTDADNQLAYLSAVTALDWADVLAVAPTSGANNPIIATGQFLQFGDGTPAAATGQIRSAANLAFNCDADISFNSAATLDFACTDSMTIAASVDIDAVAFNAMTFTGLAATAIQCATGSVAISSVSTGVVSINVPLRQTERAASPTITSGQSLWWTINSAPNKPKWTDDTNTDFDLPLGVSSTSVIWDVASLNFKRAALTGAVSAAQDSNSTLFNAIKDNGTLRPARTNINLVSTTSNIAQVVDDAGNDELEFQFQRAALTGDVTASQNSNATSIANNAVTNAKLATMAANTVKANATAGVAVPTDVAISAEGVLGRTSGNITVIGSAVQSALIRGAGSVFWASAAADQVLRRSGSGDLGFGTLVTNNIGDDQVTYAKIQNVSATDRLLGRDTAGAGNIEELTVTGGVEFTGTGIQRSALTGDVTATAGSNATTIANDAVTNAKMANMAQSTVKGRAEGAGTGDPTDLTPTQVVAIIDGEDATWSGAHIFNGDVVTNAGVGIDGDIRFRSITTSSATGAIADLAISDANVVRFTGAGPVLSGMVAVANQQVTLIVYAGSGSMTITKEGAGSSAVNRFGGTTSSVSLGPGDMTLAWYDATSSRWRVMRTDP